jgi:hypothetical protein
LNRLPGRPGRSGDSGFGESCRTSTIGCPAAAQASSSALAPR